MAPCNQLLHLNALVPSGTANPFPAFTADFCLTDLVLQLTSTTGGKSYCVIWLVTAAASEELFFFSVDEHGQRVTLNSGIVCPKDSYLSANTFTGATANLRVLLTGYYC